ncbi:MAG: hypothetical protein KOO69_02140, partial [Victivallales bacterium]|nr:hypothetical protein [Victivallales bacterium]
LIYNFAVGKANISGEDWGDIFAKSIDGGHLSSPVGLADVVLEGQSWSVKSVQSNKPHTCKELRVISGRNSPDYSYGIKNPHTDIQKTGKAIIGIWNERVNIALDQFDFLRTAILVRNVNTLEFTLFEEEARQYVANEYEWKLNTHENFEGFDKTTGKHKFTWQPHGAQFTIKYTVPSSAVRFQIKRPPILDFEQTMEQIGFNKNWVLIKN